MRFNAGDDSEHGDEDVALLPPERDPASKHAHSPLTQTLANKVTLGPKIYGPKAVLKNQILGNFEPVIDHRTGPGKESIFCYC